MKQAEYLKLSELTKLPNNPRTIKDNQFNTLVKSIQDNPDYFEARPIIVSNRTGMLIILAGNQRYEAAKKLKLKTVPVYVMEGLTEEQEKEIIIRDNISNGEWDWDMLANEWDIEELSDWGLDVQQKVEYEDQSESIQCETAKELDFYDKFVIVKFKNEQDYNEFIINNNVPQVKTSSMTGGKDIRTKFKSVFDYEDLHTIKQSPE